MPTFYQQYKYAYYLYYTIYMIIVISPVLGAYTNKYVIAQYYVTVEYFVMIHLI